MKIFSDVDFDKGIADILSEDEFLHGNGVICVCGKQGRGKEKFCDTLAYKYYCKYNLRSLYVRFTGEGSVQTINNTRLIENEKLYKIPELSDLIDELGISNGYKVKYLIIDFDSSAKAGRYIYTNGVKKYFKALIDLATDKNLIIIAMLPTMKNKKLEDRITDFSSIKYGLSLYGFVRDMFIVHEEDEGTFIRSINKNFYIKKENNDADL